MRIAAGLAILALACHARPPVPAARPARAPASRPAVTVVYTSGERPPAGGHLDCSVLGVDAAAGVVYLERHAGPANTSPATFIDAVDLARGARLWAWDPYQTHDAEGDAASLRRLAEIGARTGHGPNDPRKVRASPDGRVITDDSGDAFCVYDRDGRDMERPFPALSATFEPVFSPDGKLLVFHGYEKGKGPMGEVGIRLGALYVSAYPGAPRRIDDVPEPEGLRFAPDGTALYAMTLELLAPSRTSGLPGTYRRCLVRVDVPAFTATRLACHEGVAEDTVTIDDGAHLAAYVENAEEGGRGGRLRLLALPDGAPAAPAVDLPELVADVGAPVVVLDGAGRVVLAQGQDGRLLVIDARDGARAVLGGEGAGYQAPFGSRLLPDGRLPVLRARGDGPCELVLVDPAAALGERAAR